MPYNMDIVNTPLPSLNPASVTYLKAKRRGEKRRRVKRYIYVCVVIAIAVITYIVINFFIEVINPPSHLVRNLLK